MYAQQSLSDVMERSKLPLNDHFVAETILRIRYVEVDAMQIVHHSNYVVFFEEGRSEYARQRGKPYSDFEKDGYYLLVTEVGTRYLKPAHYEDRIMVRTWVKEMKSRGMTFNYEIVDADSGETLVTGFSKHICVTKEGKIAKIPEGWRGWMSD